jgi:hypothetical protein
MSRGWAGLLNGNPRKNYENRFIKLHGALGLELSFDICFIYLISVLLFEAGGAEII